MAKQLVIHKSFMMIGPSQIVSVMGDFCLLFNIVFILIIKKVRGGVDPFTLGCQEALI